jgi:hypothetical protein
MDDTDPIESVAPLQTTQAVSSPSWSARVIDWLEVGGKRVGIPALIVSLAALYFVVANYRLTVAANRPDLASNGFNVELAARPPHVEVHLENIGRKIARRGIATLFSLAQLDGEPVLIGTAPIIGAGTNVFAGYGSTTRFESASIQPAAFFLVCAAYFDDAGAKYEQAFLFERSQVTARDPAELAYAELATPDLSQCIAGTTSSSNIPR